MDILGHSTPATSEAHYNQARSLDASRRYQKVIDDLLRDLGEEGI